jgi:hypothetical protein
MVRIRERGVLEPGVWKPGVPEHGVHRQQDPLHRHGRPIAGLVHERGGRALDPQVSARVGAAWDRIERWLGAHAAASLQKLGFPAEGLPAWEHDTARLPDDLYASLLRHDGAEGDLGAGFQLPGGYGLASLTSYRDMRDGTART